MPALDLATAADHLLAQAVAALDAGADAGVGVPGAPARQIITVGPPPFDFGACEQVAVSISPAVRVAGTGDTSDIAEGVACLALTLAQLRVTVTRCVPSLDESARPPTAAALNAAAVPILGQGWVLWCGLRARRRSGDLFGVGQPKREVTVGPLTAIAEQGGVAGWSIDVTVQLDPDPDLGAAVP